MNKQFTYKHFTLNVAYTKTSEVYKNIKIERTERCECCWCKNFITNREEIYPEEFKNLMIELGIDYTQESEIYHMGELDDGKHLYGGWFYFKGDVIDANESNLYFPITPTFSIAFSRDYSLSFFDKKEQEQLIQIEFIAESDWIISIPPN